MTLTDLHALDVDRPTLGQVRDQIALAQSQLLAVHARGRAQEHAVAEAANLLRRALNELHKGVRS